MRVTLAGAGIDMAENGGKLLLCAAGTKAPRCDVRTNDSAVIGAAVKEKSMSV
jgi:hypothetical protein